MTNGWTKPHGMSLDRHLVSTSKPEKLYTQYAGGIHRSPWNGLKRAKQGLIWTPGLGLKSRIAQIRSPPLGTSHPLFRYSVEHARPVLISPSPEISPDISSHRRKHSTFQVEQGAESRADIGPSHNTFSWGSLRTHVRGRVLSIQVISTSYFYI